MCRTKKLTYPDERRQNHSIAKRRCPALIRVRSGALFSLFMKKWNHYTCPECGGVTIARHDNDGVTPFMLRCRVKDEVSSGHRLPGCRGMAESCFFNCSQDDSQVPHVIFYRPSADQAIEDIRKSPKRERDWLLEHYEKGGALMRENGD